MIEVKVRAKGRVIKRVMLFKERIRVIDVLRYLGLNEEEVIVIDAKKGKMLTHDVVLEGDSEIIVYMVYPREV